MHPEEASEYTRGRGDGELPRLGRIHSSLGTLVNWAIFLPVIKLT